MKSFSEFVSENAAPMNPQAKLAAEVQARKDAQKNRDNNIRKDVIKKTGQDPNKIYATARGTGSSGNQ